MYTGLGARYRMVAKIANAKVKQVLRRYFKGLPESTIAKQCKVSQPTVSRCGVTFTKRTAIVGIDKAAEEYGIMNEIKELRGLAKKLHKANTKISDALAGAEMVTIFNEFEVVPKDYQKLAKAFCKVVEPGFPEAVLKLIELEETTGKPCKELITEYEELSEKIVKGNIELAKMQEFRETVEHDLMAYLEYGKTQLDDQGA